MMNEKGDTSQFRSGKINPNKSLSLSDLLPGERIRLGVRVDNWQEAIRAAGKLLFASGAVTSDYPEAMVNVAKELGPYIVIAPGVALPHAATEAGAKQTALSLVKLADPVNFGNPDNDPVRLVIGLSAIDKKVHILALQALAELLLSKDLVDRLFNAESINSILKVLQEAEKKLAK
jgi:mannitol operon transcriptional antiterminator